MSASRKLDIAKLSTRIGNVLGLGSAKLNTMRFLARKLYATLTKEQIEAYGIAGTWEDIVTDQAITDLLHTLTEDEAEPVAVPAVVACPKYTGRPWEVSTKKSKQANKTCINKNKGINQITNV